MHQLTLIREALVVKIVMMNESCYLLKIRWALFEIRELVFKISKLFKVDE